MSTTESRERTINLGAGPSMLPTNVVLEASKGFIDYEGSGIGLAVSKKIIEAHGGTIAVDSTPGVGSTFSITLPVRDGGV